MSHPGHKSWLGRDEHGNVVEIDIDDTGGGDGGGAHPDLAVHTSLGLSAAHAHDYAAAAHAHGYADENHGHPALADAGHLHDTSHAHADYAASGHTHAAGDHPDLATHTSLGLAAAHNHDFAATGHNHDAAYAATHAHPYSSDTHDHDADYSGTAHTHDTTHNHDATYAGTAHTHVHDHDADYEALGHTHDLTAYATDADLTTHAATPHGGGDAIPAGVIVMWAGSVAAIPNGWALCDGNNGTPNLSDRFIKGTATQAGLTGGGATHNHAAHSSPLNHTHTVSVTDPGHVHVQGVNSATTGGLSGYAPDTSTNTRVNSGYSTSSATTGVTASTANPAGGVASQTHDSVNHEPAYYTLAFIQKV